MRYITPLLSKGKGWLSSLQHLWHRSRLPEWKWASIWKWRSGTFSLERLHFRQVQRLEILLCTLLPVAALLLLAVIGTKLIPDEQSTPFIWTFSIASLVVFTGELLMVLLAQRTTTLQLLALVQVCRQASSDASIRAPIGGNDELGSLAVAINGLIVSRQPNRNLLIFPQEEQVIPVPSTPADQSSLTRQIEEMLQVITPAIDGDLRVRAPVSADVLGVVADTFNYLIEELGQFIRQANFTSTQMVTTTHDLLERSIQMAQSAEAQIQRLTQTMETVESTVSFLQRMTRILQISTEAAHQARKSLQQRSDAPPSSEVLSRRLADLAERRAYLDEAIQVLEASTSRRGGRRRNTTTRASTASEEDNTQESETEAHDLVEGLILLRGALEGIEAPPAGESVWKQDANTTSLRDADHFLSGGIVEQLMQHWALLAEWTLLAESATSNAEAVVEHLYVQAEQTKELSQAVLAQAQRMSSLAVIAEQARAATSVYQLPEQREEGEKEERSVESEVEVPS